MISCPVVTQEVQLEPMSATVLQGSDVRFNANVQGVWQVMTWQVRGLLVLTVRASGEIIPSSEQFAARFCSSGVTSCVEFSIHNVTRRDTGPVICTVQGDYTPKTAQLNVQESGTVSIMGSNVTVKQDQQVEFQCVTAAWFPTPTVTWSQNGQAVDSSLYNTSSVADENYFNSSSVLKFQAVSSATVECLASVAALKAPQSSSVFMVVVPKPTDWTVLIAVVSSFGGLALLVLLILGILFCWKRRKEKQPNYQDEMSRRVRTQRQSRAGGQKQGQVNPSYVPEGQTSVTPSELTDSGFVSSTLEMPDIVNSNRAGDVDESGFRRHRHVTIV
ncbi:immunoglobulin superfamily member 5 [Melanotaenia boesemani]|uniref:immunoglobulin superfamily member 5 n=1 Tax=Melanotaenia boesemani TaxID=1250792 RepID=UPI001C03F496|nr:immunoglobulin superfamily member 5 [Melanotaenia boesemani]